MSEQPPDVIGRAADRVGPRATEAFAALGNETRLAILLALWEAFDPGSEAGVVPFSTLRERVGVRDSGQFNYHLNKLEDRFIRKTDAGYVLRPAGRKIVRAVVAGVGVEDPTFEPTPIDKPCPLCGAAIELVYTDEWLCWVCTECAGHFAASETHPRGTLSAVEVDPAAFTDRSPEAVAHAAWTTGLQEFQSAIEGVCIECSGPVTGELRVCPDHDPDEVCSSCGHRFAAMAKFRCSVCKNHQSAPPRTVVAHHPAVVAFYWAHGIPLQYETDGYAALDRRGELIDRHEQDVVATDPPRVRVSIEHDGDGLTLTLDEHLDVVGIDGGR